MVELNLDLDFNDMAIWAFIHKFSTSQSCRKIHEDGTTYFWVSRELIVDQLPKLCIGSKSGIRQRVEKLIKAKLIVRHPDNRKMNQSFYAFGPNAERLFFESTPGLKKDQHLVVKKTSPALSEDMYNNNKQVNKGKDGEPSPILSNQRGIETSNKHQKEIFKEASAWRDLTKGHEHQTAQSEDMRSLDPLKYGRDRLKLEMSEVNSKFPGTFSNLLLNEFYDHWTEPNKSKTKVKWQMQDTWDTYKRLKTWQRNDDKWNKSTKITGSESTPAYTIGQKHNAAG
ncbi:MAG TPA: hypothetical protein VGE44_14555 [Daejeonella sp.]|uniref:hypothetical protein n=1 Tax=Daejeonella sp. TaxID=2805397 RepID=UPI002ED78B17